MAESFDEFMTRLTEKHDRSTAANIKKARKTGVLGDIVSTQPPQVRRRIHDLDRRYNAKDVS